jgi:hypothetical protein
MATLPDPLLRETTRFAAQVLGLGGVGEARRGPGDTRVPFQTKHLGVQTLCAPDLQAKSTTSMLHHIKPIFPSHSI